MEVSFNVAWGPLSQIAVPLIDDNSAIQLAVGAYGWWKAKERSMSLVEMINANGGHLAPSISFNLSHYLSVRQRFQFHGIVWFDGRLESIPLPNASTGKLGDPGLMCLRAVTTALLALYNVDCTTAVLAHLIPHCLINYNLEDNDRVVANGPFLDCVRQFATSVANEEHCDALRKELHRCVDEAYKKLFSKSNGTFLLSDIHDAEIPFVIGMYKWILMTPSTRAKDCYPTRSFSCWSLATMLAFLGFDICTSLTLVTSVQLYDELISSDCHQLFKPTISLVVCDGCDTDFLAPVPESVHATDICYAARIVPIKAIPMVIFGHIRHQGLPIDMELLCHIWEEAFSHASSSVGSVRPVCKGLTREIFDQRCKESGEIAEVEPVVEYGVSAGMPYYNSQPQHMLGLAEVTIPVLKKYIPSLDWDLQLLENIIG